MSVSSNTLFHFTKELDFIKGIIKNGFQISYCLEEENAFPMISFCDLPLSSIKEQIDKYGHYAIGMTLDWGYKNKLNPIFYFQEKSEVIDSMRNAHNWSQWHMKQIISGDKKPEFLEEVKPYIQYVLDSSRFQKFYMGKLVREKETFENYKFYNEREWRFVPNINSKFVSPRMSKSEYLKFKKDFSKPHIKDLQYSLKFKARDIRHIVVESNSELTELMNFLEGQKHLYNNKTELDILKTKITTSEIIKEDY